MKTNSIQLLFICSTLICIVSCKKGIDSSFAITEEPGKSYLPVSSALSEPQERPFKGRIAGSFVGTPTSNPMVFDGIATASGNVTHLGVFNKVTSDVIDMAASTINGTFIMTNSAGEQITGSYSGTFSLELISGTLSWNLNATITGGTGRFSQATGEFIFIAQGTYVITDGIVTGNYTETFDGTIIY